MTTDDVARRIVQHLKANPHACDTFEGIMHWWMTVQRVDESIVEIRDALGQLKARGIIQERTGGDNRTFYFANDINRNDDE